MLRKSLVNVGLRASRPQYKHGIQRATVNYGNTSHRDASSTTTTTMMGDNVKLKTMDELDGPSFLTTLHWLFVKGYFQTTQQLQVSGIRREKEVPVSAVRRTDTTCC